MALLAAFAKWIASTPLNYLAIGLPWTWPICETLHFIGMALLIGAIGLLDMRMLGLYKELPAAPLEKLAPWGILGFTINAVTGIIFFAGAPQQYIYNIAFLWKIAFIAVAGINAGLFYVTGLSKIVDNLKPGEDAPPIAKFVAGSSLFLWFGVIYWGRMLPFIGNAF